MSLTATCGVVSCVAGSRGASMLAVMWWGAPSTFLSLPGPYRPLDRTDADRSPTTADSPASTSLLRPRSCGPIAHLTGYVVHEAQSNLEHPTCCECPSE